MNLLNKTTPWMVASLLTAASVFGQDKCSTKNDKCPPCNTPCDFKEMMPGMPGYNAPSRINVCGNWDLYFDASFIYWQVAQDNLNFALANQNTLAEISAPGIQGNVIGMNFNYKPGFKVGAGMNFGYDNWDSFVEYTRLHGTNSNSATNPTGGSIIANLGDSSLLVQSRAYSSVSSKFSTNLDFLDWVLARSYFVGKNLTFRSVLGARGALISQYRTAHYKNPVGSTVVAGAYGGGSFIVQNASLDVYSRVRSWGVGAETGLETSWMLGSGVRLFGNGYADMLYTKYKIQDKSVLTPMSTGISQSVISKNKVGTIRTHLDLEVGFGWGSYFDNNNWHIDLSAGYEFQVFFGQDMFTNSISTAVANGDMTLQGLTAKVRIDF